MFNQQNGKKTLNTFAIVVRSVMHFPLLRIEEGIAPFLLPINIKDLMSFHVYL